LQKILLRILPNKYKVLHYCSHHLTLHRRGKLSVDVTSLRISPFTPSAKEEHEFQSHPSFTPILGKKKIKITELKGTFGLILNGKKLPVGNQHF